MCAFQRRPEAGQHYLGKPATELFSYSNNMLSGWIELSHINVSSKLRARAVAVALPSTSLNVPLTFVGLVNLN
jgi:hypothetical protein